MDRELEEVVQSRIAWTMVTLPVLDDHSRGPEFVAAKHVFGFGAYASGICGAVSRFVGFLEVTKLMWSQRMTVAKPVLQRFDLPLILPSGIQLQA